MAQSQPAPQGAQGQRYPIKNTFYDLITVMSHCGKSIEVLDEYLQDARTANNQDIVSLFEQIRQDEVRHCQMAQNVLDKMVKQGTF